ncbi:MAG TPA: hypothetical protein VM889_09895 [Candidatus Thermoplasmatota archaeon]|nr:hypothetical protein [Candidatus Thermoplasmatota archaeon]
MQADLASAVREDGAGAALVDLEVTPGAKGAIASPPGSTDGEGA